MSTGGSSAASPPTRSTWRASTGRSSPTRTAGSGLSGRRTGGYDERDSAAVLAKWREGEHPMTEKLPPGTIVALVNDDTPTSPEYGPFRGWMELDSRGRWVRDLDDLEVDEIEEADIDWEEHPEHYSLVGVVRTDTLRGQSADDPDLHSDGAISPAGMEAPRATIEDGGAVDDDGEAVESATEILDRLTRAAEERARCQQQCDAATEVWQAAIRRAVASGAQRTAVARAAGISRERLYQILRQP